MKLPRPYKRILIDKNGIINILKKSKVRKKNTNTKMIRRRKIFIHHRVT